MPRLRIAAALAASLALTSCAGLPSTPAARSVAPQIAAEPRSQGAAPAGSPLALDDEMRAFVAREVTASDAPTRLRQLVRAVIESPDFHVDYADDTRSAAETFHALRGNCLSFTNLFVALGREAGLDVRFQEVDVPPSWTARAETFVVSRHVNALVTLRPDLLQVVDFNMPEFRSIYPRRPISDVRAAAHFHSNLGVERLQAGDAEGARGELLRALALDPTLAQAWVNLGAWHQRAGDAARAEASYLEALRIAPDDPSAMTDLASLHAAEGRAELARWYQTRIARYRAQNPYYRFERARLAYATGDYATATHELREALRRSDVDPSFYSLLGMSYRMLGRSEAARTALSRAIALAEDDATRNAYRRKLELLGPPRARGAH